MLIILKEWFVELHPVVQALVATIFTWLVTALGAALVFFFKRIDKKVLDIMLGFAAGVMIAASFWSLLAPAIEMAELTDTPSWVPAVAGFLAGGVFLRLVDRILPHLHLNEPLENAEGVHTSWNRSVLLVLAITLHNIPEGLAVGVAFGAVAAGLPSATRRSADDRLGAVLSSRKTRRKWALHGWVDNRASRRPQGKTLRGEQLLARLKKHLVWGKGSEHWLGPGSQAGRARGRLGSRFRSRPATSAGRDSEVPYLYGGRQGQTTRQTGGPSRCR